MSRAFDSADANRSIFDALLDAARRFGPRKPILEDQERNPFVLFLVDGDGYVFNESLVAKRGEGGSIAAQMLNDEIKVSLRRKGLEHCRQQT